MKRSEVFSAVILSAVIGSLCFSVGEGLRLTPFPIPTDTRAETTDVESSASTSKGAYLQSYGPLDIPTQTQKRKKRQTVDFTCPPPTSTYCVDNEQPPSFEEESVRVGSNLFIARPLGRAPPVVS